MMKTRVLLLLFGGFISFCESSRKARTVHPTFAVVKTQSEKDGDFDKYCSLSFPPVTSFPEREDNVTFRKIADGTDWNVCDGGWEPDVDIENKYVILPQNDKCLYVEMSYVVQEKGAYGAIIMVNKTSTRKVNYTDAHLNFVIVSNRTVHKILENDTSLEIGIYAPEDLELFYISLIIIWLLAMFTVTVGSYWSGVYRHKLWVLYTTEGRPVAVNRPACEPTEPEEDPIDRPKSYIQQEETSMNLSPKLIFFFVSLMCVMLLSLYFLYDYLVYVIMFMFCFASFIAIFSVLYPVIKKLPCGDCRTPYFNIYLVRGTLELRQVLLLLFALALPIIWFVLRKQPYAWILQDILGILFSINMLKMIRLNNLKICTILLSLLFFYDIFFVFITPLIMPNGESIMVEVAKGSQNGETLPMTLVVPHFSVSEMDVICHAKQAYNMLGYGDILVPGLLISFVHYFDLKVKTPYRIYFVMNIICYGLGLIVTFVGLYLMQIGQPALLYLVPFTVIPTVITAAYRGELNHMWSKNIDQNPEEEDIADGTSAISP